MTISFSINKLKNVWQKVINFRVFDRFKSDQIIPATEAKSPLGVFLGAQTAFCNEHRHLGDRGFVTSIAGSYIPHRVAKEQYSGDCITPIEALSCDGNALFIGGAASGKTILCKWLCVQISTNQKMVPSISCDLIPVYLDLRDLGNSDFCPDISASDIVARAVIHRMGWKASKEIITALRTSMESGDVLLVIDCPDLATSEQLQSVQRWTAECPAVVTMRNEPDEPLDGFRSFYLRGFDRHQVDAYVHSWAIKRSRHLGRMIDPTAMLSHIRNGDLHPSVAYHPFYLNMSLVLLSAGSNVPDQKPMILKKFFEGEVRRIPPSDAESPYAPPVRSQLWAGRMALRIFKKKLAGNAAQDIDQNWRNCLKGEVLDVFDATILDEKVKAHIDWVVLSTALIEPASLNGYRFTSEASLECFAALYLSGELLTQRFVLGVDEDVSSERTLELAAKPDWAPVIQSAVEMINSKDDYDWIEDIKEKLRGVSGDLAA